ncbi:DUF4301 family protein [Sediminitomix flava]|nr:DUF4301 family protein [Sediminitomix flava]
MNIELSIADQELLNDKSISSEQIFSQLNYFRNGFPPMNIVRPAIKKDGIIKLSESQKISYELQYDAAIENKEVMKFVPASGAATRMFKVMYEFLRKHRGTEVGQADFTEYPSDHDVMVLFDRIKDFAFYYDLKEMLAEKGGDIDDLLTQRAYVQMLETLLEGDGMEYGSLPKGLLKFHKYGESEMRTPVEEHLVEGAMYGKSTGNVVKIHFTVSPEHMERFQKHLEVVQPIYEERFHTSFEITFSVQKPATDTIAATMDNKPFRMENGKILFRPGGHGALIENLNDLDSDIIFIKNIDNVQPDRLKPDVEFNKKVLAGVLISYQKKVFKYLNLIDEGNVGFELRSEMENFLKEDLYTVFPKSYQDLSDEGKLEYLHTKLNRPIRVSGMVKNEGEPGGGPFWAVNPDGSISLQIVESAQIDMNDPAKVAVVEQATHFNPVDLVCGVRNYKGEKFNLLDFRDSDTGFIAIKSRNGEEVKSQELPGLWNGAMSDWNTIFVEAPAATFSPVKKVNDLLRRAHWTKDQLFLLS